MSPNTEGNKQTIINLISKTFENQLIKDYRDLDFLFGTYGKFVESKSLSVLTKEVLEWAFENDKLEDFFSEYLEELAESGFSTILIDCEIVDNSSIRTYTIFELHLFHSKSLYYFKVFGNGPNSDLLGSQGFYQIAKESEIGNVISKFKNECVEVFTSNGEFDLDELIEEGSEIIFNQYFE